ncbi:reverse transcriptase domain-containing protein [Tanacetum coccineum]
MEMEEVSRQYSTPFFIDGLNTYDGEVNMEYEKNMISNDFVVKLFIINPEQDDVKPKVVFGRSFLKITKGIVDFRNRILTIYPDLITYNDDSDDELDELLASVDVSDLPPLDVTDILPFMCSMGKSARIKKQPWKNYKMSYNGEGPSLTIKRPLNQEDVSREELENDIYERILIHNEPRPIIVTLNYSDQHKKLLDSVLLDKLKLDGEVEVEEAATEEFIRSYKAIKEKNDPGVFVLPIRLEVKFDFHSLADTGSNINVIPYRIYEKLGRDQVKPVSHKITMLDHSKAEPIGILKDVLCQVGVIMILANFLLLDIPVDCDVPIILGRSFLYTCRAIMNTLKELLQPSMTVGTHDDEAGFSLPKITRQHETVKEAMLPRVHRDFLQWGNANRTVKSQYNTNLARLPPKQIYSPCIVDWGVLNNLGCAKEIKAMLEIKLYEMGGEEEKRRYSVSNLGDVPLTSMNQSMQSYVMSFIPPTSLMSSHEIRDGGFEVYFQGGLRNDDHFNAIKYWLSISSEEELRYLGVQTRPLGDLYERMGSMEIRHGVLERMSRRQLYLIVTEEFLSIWLDNITFHCREPTHHLVMTRKSSRRSSVEMAHVGIW